MHATILVFTFKEGLFARLAHDLRLHLGDFEATLQGSAVRARCSLASLFVDGVAHGQAVDTHALSDSDKQKIHETMVGEILQTHAHPDASFEGQVQERGAGRLSVEGRLSLHGVTQPCTFELVAGASPNAPWAGELTLIPSRFRIPPYKALGGAIRLADRVVVRVSVSLDGQAAHTLLATPAVTRVAPG